MKKKTFDAVKLMRELRDNLSKRFNQMSFEEQREYIKNNVKTKDQRKRELAGASTDG